MCPERRLPKIKPIGDVLKARPRKMNGSPRKIGVVNPYMLVYMLSPPEEFAGMDSALEIIDKIDLKDKATLRLLNSYFKKTGQVTVSLSYRQMFDPKISPMYKAPKKIPKIPPWMKHKKKVGHGEENPDIPPDPRTYGPHGGAPVFVRGDRAKKSEIFGDVIQGAAVDCYFLASLHSHVWINWATFPTTMNEIKFSGQTIPVTATCLLNGSGKPVGAQLTPNNEYWVCAYEKAYAEFFDLPKSLKPGATGTWHTPPYDPDVLAFWQGDPLQSLSEITDLPYDFTSETFGVPSAYDDPNNYSSCYETLYSDNYGSDANNSMIPANPTIAWTKETSGIYGPAGAIVPNHAYSVLGTFTYNTIKYIVLRNPWAKSIVWNYQDPIIAKRYPNLCPAGTYNPPGLNQGIPLGTQAGVQPSFRGIFGFKDDAFKTYFEGFGWVQ